MTVNIMLVDEVLRLQALGHSSKRVAREVGWRVETVREVARRAGLPFGSLRFIEGAPVRSLPPSRELVEAFDELSSGRCAYIEEDVDDPEARPCGASCCIVEIVESSKQRRRRSVRVSAWCAEHHLVVYPNVADDFRRIIIDGGPG